MMNAPQPLQNLPEETASQSSRSSKALPSEWVERLFARFSGMYGSKFADLWRGTDLSNVKAIWAEDLGGFTGEEIKRGIDACKGRAFPPTLPEFVGLCRPPIDYEAMYHHAIAQMHNRHSGQAEAWKSRAVYWAAASLGGDMQQPYAVLKNRWKTALDEFMADEPLPEIPAAVPQLPSPGKQTAAPEVVKAATQTIRAMTGNRKDGMNHWRNIRARHHAGERFPEITLKYAREALASIGEAFEPVEQEKAA